MRIQITTIIVACLLTATAATAQQPPTLNRGATIKSPAAHPDQTLGMALLAAYVNSDGTIAKGAGATGAVHITTGAYEVDFNRDVSGCFYSAVSFVQLIPAFVEPRSGVPDAVFLEIISTDGSSTLTDGAFYLTVFCAN